MHRYPLIDVLRGLAALWVLVYHVLAHREWPGFEYAGLWKLPAMGWVGVDLFLVISGFVIGKTAMDASQRGGPWRWSYMQRRLRRIAPLYYTTLVLALLLVTPGLSGQGGAAVAHIGLHLGFVHNLWHETHGSINSPSWSVGLEMQFYLLMAFCAPWLARSSMLKVAGLWITIALAWKFATTLVLVPGQSPAILQFIYASQLPGVLDEFVMGICVAKLLHSGVLRGGTGQRLAWAAAAVLLLGAAWLTLESESAYWRSTPHIVAWRTLVCSGFAALLVCVLMVRGDGGRVLWPLRYLGQISYGIYLWHMPVLLTLLAQTALKGPSLLLATAGATVALAALSWHGLERRWLLPSRGGQVGAGLISGRP